MRSFERVLGGMESEPMFTPREESPLPEKFSTEEDQTHDTASSRTVSPTHHKQAIPAPSVCLQSGRPAFDAHFLHGAFVGLSRTCCYRVSARTDCVCVSTL